MRCSGKNSARMDLREKYGFMDSFAMDYTDLHGCSNDYLRNGLVSIGTSYQNDKPSNSI